MLPPIDDSILQANPKFAALHKHLANNILNPNGSTKHHPAQKERDAVSSVYTPPPHFTSPSTNPPIQALKTSQTRASKSSLLTTVLQNLDINPTPTTPKSKPQLPPDLLELILLLSSHLTSTLPASQTVLLESTPQWTSIPHHLPHLGTLISIHLHTQALSLSRILTPTTNPSFLHRGIPKLVPTITALQTSLTARKTSLSTARSALTTLTLHLLHAYQTATTLTIQILETSKHGSLSLERHYSVKITYLAQVLERVRLEAQEKKARGEKMVYSEEVMRALGVYGRCLGDGRVRFRERKEQAERVLWGYGVGREEGGNGGKEKVMREVGRVYGELMGEVREVGRDVERLRGRG